jgi:Domain of unknown function (DUF4386)
VTVGRSLVAVHDWTFLLGPGWVVGVGNGLILGYLMYRSGLVPRRMAMLGLIGGPLIILSGTAVLFNVIQPGSAAQVIATIPEFVWELSLGIYLMVKGWIAPASGRLRSSPALAEMPGRTSVPRPLRCLTDNLLHGAQLGARLRPGSDYLPESAHRHGDVGLGVGLPLRRALAAVCPQASVSPVPVSAAAVRVQQAAAGRARADQTGHPAARTVQ